MSLFSCFKWDMVSIILYCFLLVNFLQLEQMASICSSDWLSKDFPVLLKKICHIIRNNVLSIFLSMQLKKKSIQIMNQAFTLMQIGPVGIGMALLSQYINYLMFDELNMKLCSKLIFLRFLQIQASIEGKGSLKKIKK